MDRNPLLICEWTDPATQAKGYFVIDTLVDGLCAGGIRMRCGVSLQEVARLARTMTHKLAAIDSPFGGSKAGIDYDPSAPDSLQVLKRFLLAFKPFLLDVWLTNEDLGTKEEEIIAILHELGISSPFEAAVKRFSDRLAVTNAAHAFSKLRIDGFRVSDAITGYGVAEVVLEALQRLEMPIDEAQVAIQGFGSVGGSAARFLSKAGLKVVAVADIEGTIFDPSGLDIDYLLTRRNRQGVIARNGLPKSYSMLPRDAWLSLDVRVLIPAAIPDAITEANVDLIKARLIVEGANIPTTAGAESQLFARGVVVIPDFVANAGAVGLATAVITGRVEPNVSACLAYISNRLRSTTARVLGLSQREQISPREAAVKIVEQKVASVALNQLKAG